MREALWVELGRTAYAPVHELQRRIVNARARDEIRDVFLVTEHDPVLTLGRGTHAANVLVDDIETVEVERGGDVTYHGPGQVVVYPIVKLEGDERDLHQWLRNLEEVILVTLSAFGIEGRREPGKTGVWIAHRKIASIGVAVSRWVTYHGLSLNVTTSLAEFERIRPCGLDSRVMTSLEREAQRPISLEDVIGALAASCARVLERELTRTSIDEVRSALIRQSESRS